MDDAAGRHLRGARVLLVEDDADGRRSVQDVLEEAGCAVEATDCAAAAEEALARGVFDAVVTDLMLPDRDGLAVLEAARRADPHMPVLFITAFGSVETAVAALQQGAQDYLLKPLDLNTLQAKVARAVEVRRLRDEVDRLRGDLGTPFGLERFVATDPAMQAFVRQLRAAGGTDATVLLLGESGTGKEVAARALHNVGCRASGPFVAVNCGALAESLLESELFGHERGAFTGATALRRGAFERAHGGTLFLDEIGIAPPSVQARLLRVLEDREIMRVGGQAVVRVDVRVVAASNRDLTSRVAENAFRHDLLYRLAVVVLRLPPLRQRPGDIRPLAVLFLQDACRRHGRAFDRVDDTFFAALEQHRWPGNARELRNAVESAVVLARGSVLAGGDLRLGGAAAGAPSLPELERVAIMDALRRYGGNRTLAARALKVSVRTIQRKLATWGMAESREF